MQNNRFLHASRIFGATSLLAALVMLTSCSTPSITNMTSTTLAPNPSGVYTITANVKPAASNAIPNSESVKIVIGGNAYDMTQAPNSNNLYTFDYQAPPGATQIAYYFLAQYNVANSGVITARTDYSTLQHGAIGWQGGTPQAVYVVQQPAYAQPQSQPGYMTNTAYVQPQPQPAANYYTPRNTYVPPPPPATNYTANTYVPPQPAPSYTANTYVPPQPPPPQPAPSYQASNTYVPPPPPPPPVNYQANNPPAHINAAPSDGSTLNAGSFGSGPSTATVTPDAPPTSNSININSPTSDITIDPSNIEIYKDQSYVVKFILPTIVTGSPLLINVTTDIPASVIMPEVYVKPGSNVASVYIKGGAAGQGHLYANAAGYPNTVSVPIVVK